MVELEKTGTLPSEAVVLSPKVTKFELAEKQTIYNLKQKYKDAVLFELFEDEDMLHSVLSHRVLVSASGLNAIIKRLNEADPSPIKMERQGKFTIYSLEDPGKEYVRKELLQKIVLSEHDEKSVHNIYKLLNVFKDQNPETWVDKLEKILEGGGNQNEDEEGIGFIKELSKYYSRYNKGAEILLGLAVTDKELNKKIEAYLRANKDRILDNVWDILNYWEEEDTFEVYRLIDCLFNALSDGGEFPDSDNFSLTDVECYMEKVSDKIQAGLCQAMFRKMSKSEVIHLWLEYGVEKHLAIYLAEKYSNCCID